MLTGTCACGTVRWEAGGAPTPPSHCHCSMCRKAHGAGFASFTSCAPEEFRIAAGAEAVRTFTSSPGVLRRFCGTCGSSLPGMVAAIGRVVLPLGTVDGDPGLRGGRRQFADDAPPWLRIADGLESFPAFQSGRAGAGRTAVAPPALGPRAEGETRGACLCGTVAFTLTGPFRAVHNCHCSRCRKARAAAHTTNGFLPVAEFRWDRGEAFVESWRMPEAAAFGQAFCTRCGSGMPRVNRERGMVSVPLGALDDDPGPIVQDHIFVGSKAPWWEIADDGLERFAEMPPA